MIPTQTLLHLIAGCVICSKIFVEITIIAEFSAKGPMDIDAGDIVSSHRFIWSSHDFSLLFEGVLVSYEGFSKKDYSSEAEQGKQYRDKQE